VMVKNVGVVGVGKVGLPLALVMAKHFEVKAVDMSSEVVNRIQNRGHFTEKNVNKYLEQYGSRLKVSTDFNLLRNCEVIFIVVGTQTESYSPKNVKLALRKLAPYLTDSNQVLVVVSTVNPTDMNREIIPLLIHLQVKSETKGICYNPTMIALGNAIEGFEHPEYVLIGESDKEAGNKLENIWKKVVPNGTPIIRSNITTIETAKFALNLALVNKISLINTITEFCEKVNADIDRVAEILKLDPRIAGKKMFRGGLGFGGPCFPRDVVAFKRVSKNFGASSYLCDAIQQVNQQQISRSVQLIESFHKKRISILGATYKPNTSIIVESQALEIAHTLQRKGYEVIIYDPSGAENAKPHLKGVKFADDMRKCVRDGEIVLIAVPWSEFSELGSKDFNEGQIIIDAWRVLREKELPCKYIAYGLKWK
jgi:UDPglucose 6-dehydrogenase